MSASPEIHHCKSCGHRFEGSYCNHCGEKVLTPTDRSFKAFINTILIAITFADSTVFKTLREVIVHPGHISREFVEGRRVKYLRPLSLFFVLNLIYFLFPVIQLFNASLNTQLLAPFAGWYKGIIAAKMVHRNLDLNSFSMLYNLKTTGLAKMLVMVFVFFASLPLNVIYRKKNRFFTDHIDYMVELACFNLFVNAIVLTLVTLLFRLGGYLNEFSLTIIFICTNLYFLVRSGFIFYRERGWRLALKSILMLAFLKIALEIYRAVLFFITMMAL